MIITKEGKILDIDFEATVQYYQEHSLCDCSECRNFYAQAREKFPGLTTFLAELGVDIQRPDEIGSIALGDEVDYHFVAYTVNGRILEHDGYEIDIRDGEAALSIVIDNSYFPNEQKIEDHFTVTVYNIRLPWELDEPFPEDAVAEEKPGLMAGIFSKIFRKK
ncbi:MAG: hypothetical protein IKY18_07045 [Oscillospiraceae bacterium]|nr:hypothetical protein [Oscillospiraceae bacterium]